MTTKMKLRDQTLRALSSRSVLRSIDSARPWCEAFGMVPVPQVFRLDGR